MINKLNYFLVFSSLSLIFYITVSFIERDSGIVCKDTLVITETGQCVFNKYGSGSCSVMLSDGSSTRLSTTSVVGEKIIKCFRNNGDILYKRP